MKIALRDRTILDPIAFLGPDLTASEWAQKLNVSLDEVAAAFRILGTKPRQESAPKRDDTARKVLSAVRKGHYTPKEISIITGYHPTTIRHKLNNLARLGLVQRAGKGFYTRWVEA